VPSLAQNYLCDELTPIPLAAQIMGCDPFLMAAMAQELQRRGAPRIDINCGCPSQTVTGRGAGSSLLKEPRFLHEICHAVVQAVSVPVTIKMRSGYQDTSLFQDNLLAAQESGARYITLHPRTKVDGYGPPAQWELIAQAKALLKIPVVGNGDILTVEDALKMLKSTQCDGLMIGRGSVINPFIFHQIRSHFSGLPYESKWEDLMRYLQVYLHAIPAQMAMKSRVNKFKQLFGFLFKSSPKLQERRQAMLSASYSDPEIFLERVTPLLREGWAYAKSL
jgi:tRNA-dihydrouridine synthase C